MFSRRLFLLNLIWIFTACNSPDTPMLGKLSIGIVSYGESDRFIEPYSKLIEYLGARLKMIIELEPIYNERRALTLIKQSKLSIVFAPPGLAAIAIAEAQYIPVLPLEGVKKSRSVIVVERESPIQDLTELAGKVIALGQPGSATGYYLPIYNLYGLTLAEVRFAPTPKQVLEWIASEEVVAGALSLEELERYRLDYSQTRFRILYIDSHKIPSGSILIGPTVERNLQQEIHKALESASSSMAASAGYIPNAKAPDYDYLIEVVQKVRPIAERIQEKPAPLYSLPFEL
ncbi:PhnD/SsuA/transferrin family substrate-binding protein [Moorena producens JHB]|uniref:PhnD/SsuA/transferrin family substrate-binding protein n=1 Tax=Moorena producens (strain JHB) TaxID=1454205 RepID=A0A1D9G1I7_MOOP1|nr:PhnD/SsuA/transferrin family substrate-binding protein [Moorena producens]AOY81421.1 PhnD/SsuA/transferrin family substrate-binding protein [Moorena producens JHB]